MKDVVSIRLERCLGCKSCEIACAVAHSCAGELMALIRSGEKPKSRVIVEAYGQKAVPIHCNHCEEAVCVLVCPTGAVYRKSKADPVLVDGARCIGCRMCVQACPFGVIAMNPEGKGVLKCDLCVERLNQGKEPACVVSCPTKALVFGDEKKAGRAKRQRAAAQMAEAAEQKKGSAR
jgi:carbon-monoxide dehydrogenase iron sulfur subunit